MFFLMSYASCEGSDHCDVVSYPTWITKEGILNNIIKKFSFQLNDTCKYPFDLPGEYLYLFSAENTEWII